MSVGAYHDVRACYTFATPSMFTQRHIRLVIGRGNERLVVLNYKLSVATTRRIFCEQHTYNTERWCFKPKVVYRYSSNKFGYTPPAEVNFAIRYCTYALGSCQIVYSFPTVLAITYTSERKSFVELNLTSNRYIHLLYQIHAERKTHCCVREETKVYAPQVSFGLKTHSERQITYVIGSYTQKHITLSYSVHSERFNIGIAYHQSNMYVPKVMTAIANLSDERRCIAAKSSIHDERYCWFLTSPMSERAVMLKYTIVSERTVTFYVGRVNRIYTFIATPSRLVPSERFVFCWGYAYHTVRKCFAEMRPLWFEKTPLASTPVLSVRSKLDKEISVKLMNDRPLEATGLEGKTEVIKQLAKYTTISQVEKDLLRVSAVDNTGALVGSFVDNKERVLACSQVVEGLIVHNLNGGDANSNSAATFDGGDANNNSNTILDGDE